MNRRISHADAMRSTPGRGRVTHSRPRYCSPSTGPVAFVAVARSRLPDVVFLEPRQECCDAIPAGAPEEIDVLDRGQPFSKDLQEAANGGCARAARSSSARRAFQDLLDVASQHRVSLLTRTPKLLNQPIVRPGIDDGRLQTRSRLLRPP